MSKNFLVKSFLSIDEHTMEDMIVLRNTTLLDIKDNIQKGIDELFNGRDNFQFIDSSCTEKDEVSLNNFLIQELSDLEAMAIEKFIGKSSFGFGLLIHIDLK